MRWLINYDARRALELLFSSEIFFWKDFCVLLRKVMLCIKDTLNSLYKDLVELRHCRASWECAASCCTDFTGQTLLQPFVLWIKIYLCASIICPVLRALVGVEMCVGLTWAADPLLRVLLSISSYSICAFFSLSFILLSLLSQKYLGGQSLIIEMTVWNSWKRWNQNGIWISVSGLNVAQVKHFTTKSEKCT